MPFSWKIWACQGIIPPTSLSGTTAEGRVEKRSHFTTLTTLSEFLFYSGFELICNTKQSRKHSWACCNQTLNASWAKGNRVWLQPSSQELPAAAHRLQKHGHWLQCHWDFWVKTKSKNIFSLWEEKPIRPMFIRKPEGFRLTGFKKREKSA